MYRVETKHYQKVLDHDYAMAVYYHLEENIQWEDGSFVHVCMHRTS